MERTAINPWTWQDTRGFTQAWRIHGAQTLLFVSGQGPLDAEGNLIGDGDFEAQVHQTFDNLTTVLRQAEYTLADIVKVTVYLTDITLLSLYGRIKNDYIAALQPASTAIGVRTLALPGMLLEVEAIAAR